MQLVTVVFKVDKAAQKRYTNYYNGYKGDSTKRFQYLWDNKYPIRRDIKRGDFVVVNTPAGGLTVVQVVDVADYPFTSQMTHKRIVDLVDWKSFVAREEEILAEARRLEEQARAQEALRRRVAANMATLKAQIKCRESELKEEALKQLVDRIQANDPKLIDLKERLSNMEFTLQTGQPHNQSDADGDVDVESGASLGDILAGITNAYGVFDN